MDAEKKQDERIQKASWGCFALFYTLLAVGAGLFVWGVVEVIQLIGRLG